jgi:hypothetical protein
LVITGRFEDIAAYDKFFVFMGLDNKFRNAFGFFINSNRHPLSNRRMFILRSQVQIPPNSYNFLKKPQPSYIDCHEPYEIDFFEMVNALVEAPSKISGHLTPAHLQDVVSCVQDNPTFTPEQKTLLTCQLILPPNFLA